MNKKICISGYYGFDNFGDELILKILVENLKEMSAVKEITVFSSNPEKTAKTLQVSSVNSFKIFDVIKSLIKSDYLISGGGSLLQDVTSAKSLIYYLGIIFLAQLMGKKTVIFAQGIGPINNRFLRKITEFVLKKVNRITVRDTNSQRFLSSRNINSLLCSDPVWNLKTMPQKTGKIGVQLREFHTLGEDFLNQLANALKKHYKDKEIYIYSLQNTLDSEVCNRLKEKLDNATVVMNNSNEQTIKDLSELDTLIAMRFHACLIAIKSGVKLLPVNYDIKVEQLAREFSLNCLSLDDLSRNDEIFDNFANKEITYDQESINKRKFDFKTLEEIISK